MSRIAIIIDKSILEEKKPLNNLSSLIKIFKNSELNNEGAFDIYSPF